MSIERSQSSNSQNSTREVERPRDRPQDKVREEPKAELVDRFRTLMQARAEGGEQRPDPRLQGREAAEATRGEGLADDARQHAATDNAIGRKGGDHGEAGRQSGGDALQPAELAALYQAQLLARDGPAMATPPTMPQAQGNPQALADMLERHVRQLAVSAGGTRAEDGQVLLRLSDATLPGTDLLLSRTETGWRLRADVRSRGSFDAIRQAAPKLAERFAARDLGTLEIEPHLHA